MARINLGLSYILATVLHFLIFVVSIAVIGLYAQDVSRAREDGSHVDSKLGYAVFCGALSAITCIVYFIPPIVEMAGLIALGWNTLMFVFWIALFGTFGSIYIKKKAHGNGHIMCMKNAVWVDLVGALLWLIAIFVAAASWWRNRDTRTRFTGRARV